MEKIIILNLKNIKSKKDLLKLFLEKFKFNDEYLLPGNWDALDDDLSALDFGDEIKVVRLILTDWLQYEKNNKEDSAILLSILATNTDPAQRVDNYDFIFQVRLND